MARRLQIPAIAYAKEVPMKIQFLGATQTVTGSKYLVTSASGKHLLVDCGLFQGFKDLRLRNRRPLPIAPADISAVALTHAHIDHIGYLPLLVKEGFNGPVYCTPGTIDLARVMLPDAAFLQEEEARFANRHGYSKHKPALPLYTGEDAERALEMLRPVKLNQAVPVKPDLTLTFTAAGHIIGAASLHVQNGGRSILFSGDIGRPDDPVMRPPAIPPAADYIVLESTYGNREHSTIDAKVEIERAVKEIVECRKVLLMPAFAVGRSQVMLFFLHQLMKERRIPRIPVFLDSPMASSATDIFSRHPQDHKLSEDECREVFSIAQRTATPDDSKRLNHMPGPMIIISASGMATGGRVLHHLSRLAPEPGNIIMFTGFQAAGTRGASMMGGARYVRIFGADVPVRASVRNLESLSAHADGRQSIQWMRQLDRAPKRVFLTHGEPAAADALRWMIEKELGWEVEVPFYLEQEQLA
jgi:metallo-beta-lactamase family protein